MNCDEARAFVDASVDGELDLIRQVAIEGHLEACPSCARLYEARRAVQSAVRTSGLYFHAPDGLEERVRRIADRASQSPSRLRSWPVLAAAAALVLLSVTAALVIGSWRARQADMVAQEILSAHVRSLLPGHLTDVVSSDHHTVKPWFAGKVDFSPPVPDLGNEGFPLAGGRIDYVAGRTVAALVYTRRKHVLNVFVWPSNSESPEREEHSHGYNLVRWSRAGVECWVISDVAAGDLEQFARLFRQRTGP